MLRDGETKQPQSFGHSDHIQSKEDCRMIIQHDFDSKSSPSVFYIFLLLSLSTAVYAANVTTTATQNYCLYPHRFLYLVQK